MERISASQQEPKPTEACINGHPTHKNWSMCEQSQQGVSQRFLHEKTLSIWNPRCHLFTGIAIKQARPQAHPRAAHFGSQLVTGEKNGLQIHWLPLNTTVRNILPLAWLQRLLSVPCLSLDAILPSSLQPLAMPSFCFSLLALYKPSQLFKESMWAWALSVGSPPVVPQHP